MPVFTFLKRTWKPAVISMMVFVLITATVVTVLTLRHLKGAPETFEIILSDVKKIRVLDRRGIPLSVTYQNYWNIHDYVPLYDIPAFLQKAVVMAEDQRFFEHHGVDWIARCHALWQNVCSLSPVRGASTISEQVIRMIHSRPRTLFTRWLEGFEAARLERVFSKADILEFYLNQVPYAANRRGVVQAARYFFHRDLSTLSRKEMIALAVMIKSPGRLNLYRNRSKIEGSVERLAVRLARAGIMDLSSVERVINERFHLEKPTLPVRAFHFVNQVMNREKFGISNGRRFIRTTIDSELQKTIQGVVDERVSGLKQNNVNNAAALVVDHMDNQVLAWVVAGAGSPDVPGGLIDPVITPRQPGSALKPFLYALALESGWTAATLIQDTPIVESVGSGLHAYQNYNRTFYGPVTLRQALANSLNVPAIRTVQFVGIDHYLRCLRNVGFESLFRHPRHYGDGLALGNGEVTLFEMVQAYTTLARKGVFTPLEYVMSSMGGRYAVQRFSPEVASLISSILSDPQARMLEFGQGNLLNFPVQTAVKTGTSSDYQDSWAVGFNHRYTAGVWMGNLDRMPTEGVTGSTGPALVLRSIFAELNKLCETQPLYMSPDLIKMDICRDSPTPSLLPICRTEWFVPGTVHDQSCTDTAVKYIDFQQPTDGIQLAQDPRIPDDLEAFQFILNGTVPTDRILWTVDGRNVGNTRGGRYLWKVERGVHLVQAHVFRDNHLLAVTQHVRFIVK